MASERKTAAKFLLETEAELARLALAEAGIEAWIEGRPLFGTGVLSMGGRDAFKLRVATAEVDAARSVLRRIDGGDLELPEDATPGDTEPPPE